MRSGFSIVADEGVERSIVLALRAAGLQVRYVTESDRLSDEDILEMARERNSLLVTLDKDFGELVYRGENESGGILLLRLAGLAADAKVRMVLDAVSGHGSELLSAFSVLSPRSLRVRPR